MTRRYRDLHRLLEHVAAEAGARLLELRQTNGNHLRARFDRGTLVYISGTPSDRRFADRQVVADVGRQLRACGTRLSP